MVDIPATLAAVDADLAAILTRRTALDAEAEALDARQRALEQARTSLVALARLLNPEPRIPDPAPRPIAAGPICELCDLPFPRRSNAQKVCDECREKRGAKRANLDDLVARKDDGKPIFTFEARACRVTNCGRIFAPRVGNEVVCAECRTAHGLRGPDRINAKIRREARAAARTAAAEARLERKRARRAGLLAKATKTHGGHYKTGACRACGATFTKTGHRQTVCGDCKAAAPKDATVDQIIAWKKGTNGGDTGRTQPAPDGGARGGARHRDAALASDDGGAARSPRGDDARREGPPPPGARESTRGRARGVEARGRGAELRQAEATEQTETAGELEESDREREPEDEPLTVGVDLDDLDTDQDEDFDEAERAVALAPPPVRRRARGPDLVISKAQEAAAKKTRVANRGSWWIDKSRDEFSRTAAVRGDELKGSKEAARVKTPLVLT